jgi:hypothetical protein
MPQGRRQYLDLIVWSGIINLQPVTRSILLEIVKYRRFFATRRLGKPRRMPKLPDAIHVVTAMQAKCTHFLSADAALKLPTPLQHVKPDRAGIMTVIRQLA